MNWLSAASYLRKAREDGRGRRLLVDGRVQAPQDGEVRLARDLPVQQREEQGMRSSSDCLNTFTCQCPLTSHTGTSGVLRKSPTRE